MSLYDGIKDAAKLMQQADNIDLYRKLLDLSAEALDLQAENAQLKEELRELHRQKDVTDRIIRHKHPFITLLGEPEQKYCATCWGKEKQFIQMLSYIYYGAPTLRCPNCKSCCDDEPVKE